MSNLFAKAKANLKLLEGITESEEQRRAELLKEIQELEDKFIHGNISSFEREKILVELPFKLREIARLKNTILRQTKIRSALKQKLGNTKTLKNHYNFVKSQMQQPQTTTSTTSKSSWWSRMPSIPSFSPKQTTTTSTVKNAVRNNLTRRAKANQNTLKQAEQLLGKVNKSFPSTTNISEEEINRYISNLPKTTTQPPNTSFNLNAELAALTNKEVDQWKNKWKKKTMEPGPTIEKELNLNAELAELTNEKVAQWKNTWKNKTMKPVPTINELKARLKALKEGGKSRKHKSRKASRRRLTRRRR